MGPHSWHKMLLQNCPAGGILPRETLLGQALLQEGSLGFPEGKDPGLGLGLGFASLLALPCTERPRSSRAKLWLPLLVVSQFYLQVNVSIIGAGEFGVLDFAAGDPSREIGPGRHHARGAWASATAWGQQKQERELRDGSLRH